ncbi:inorganic phosphate transporter [Acetobacterium bakii]|uniref:Phosphate transporter n=1 Tax=Acetobacterium bakii TaxID=52689 RepID=A0A0L6U092_9FIRM|nr:inorganic phosphate transporter [Acetobacterium bakii]KNZ41914.1 phosphate transporter [Acetobacterium bakii]
MIEVSTTFVLILVILIGLVFTFTNGLHDASAVVATFINCGAASPKQGIILASIFGIIGAVLGGNLVADTISGVISLPTDAFLLMVLLAAIMGATLWDLITWRLGLPSSSTHSFVGGIIGAVMVSAGPEHILWGWAELVGPNHEVTGIVKVVIALIISPIIGFMLAFILEKISEILLRNAKISINRWIKRSQWLIVSLLSFTNGSNDIQKIMGIFVLALAAASGSMVETAPLWMRFIGGFAMFVGIMMGGWRIMKTLGRGIFEIKPIHSINSQLASLGSILGANLTGAPVSSTQIIVGSIMGVGTADAYKMVNWKIVKEIIVAWFITIPLAGIIAAGIYLAMNLLLNMA